MFKAKEQFHLFVIDVEAPMFFDTLMYTCECSTVGVSSMGGKLHVKSMQPVRIAFALSYT